MGYQVAVTPLQMAAAVSSVANRGELLEPRIVRAVITNGGRAPVPRKVGTAHGICEYSRGADGNHGTGGRARDGKERAD